MNRAICLLTVSTIWTVGLWLDAAETTEAIPSEFVQTYCADCHNKETAEAGLDLISLPRALDVAANFSAWVKVHDRVQKGEMPPEDAERPQPAETTAFLNHLSSELLAADRARVAAEGRATRRRMNRFEYENTLRDLLSLPALEVRDFLPEDSLSGGLNKVGEALDVSHVQIARYLKASEFALRQAMVPVAERPETTITRYHAWDQRGLFKDAGPTIRKTFPLLGLELRQVPRRRRGEGPSEPQPQPTPEERERQSVAIVVSTYEPTEIQFDGFRAPLSARYRLRFSAFTIWMSPDFQKVMPGRRWEPISIYSDRTPAIYRKLGGFDVGPEPTVCELEAWIGAGETIRPDAARLVRSRPPDFKNPFAEADGMPGVAFQWMEVEGPLYDEWPPRGHQLLFGDLPMVNKERPPPGPPPTGFRRRATPPPPPGVEIVSSDPTADAERLLRHFMERAYQRPIPEQELQRFQRVIQAALDAGHSFTDAMIAGYTAVLSSPSFIYFVEQPGPLDDIALANRLSYFLWNTRPDEELLGLAAEGKLRDRELLRQQTDRLLDDARSRQFVDAFLDYWLDLRLIVATSPDVSLYPDYDLDDLLVESMVEETQLFFHELVRKDLGAAHLIDSDFTFVNERLAVHYGIPGIERVEMRRVSLPHDSVRGGLLTQGSTLKVTANGTTTSPVKRGVWVMDRILGQPPPPPPEKVPEVKPDVRGATTIREQLALHRAIESCNKCHQQIDPVGLALENFDVLGGWRDRYRSLGSGEPVEGVGHNGLRFRFRQGPPVEPQAELPDGRKFQNAEELKQCLLQDVEKVASNLVQRLTVYATGAPIRFSDRPAIDDIVARTEPSGYGVRTLIHEIVQSEMFLNK